MKDAAKRQAQIQLRKPEIQGQIQGLQTRVQQEATESECAKQIAGLEKYIAEIGYDTERHNQVRLAVRKMQSWQLQYQHLQAAQQQYPQLRARLQRLR